MSIIKSLYTTSETAIDKAEEFFKCSKEYYKLKIFQILTSSLSLIFRFAIISVFILIAFIFLAISTSKAINNQLNSEFLGHVIVASFFILFAFITYLAKNKIENLIIKNLSKKYFDNEELL